MTGFRAMVIGGSGVFGQYAVAALTRIPECDSVVCVGRNPAKLELVERRFGSSVTSAVADLNDHERLVEVARTCDVVVNAAGPSAHLAHWALSASIKAGKPYADLCDDAHGYEALRSLAAEARDAQITAVSGAGCSAGITNIAAAELCELFDEVTRIDVYHGAPPGESLGGLANLVHLLDLISGEVPILRNGCLVDETAFESMTRYDFGGDLGEITCALISHPEPLMFKDDYPDLVESRVWLGLMPEEQMETLRVLSRTGLAGDTFVIVEGNSVSVRDVVARHLLLQSGTDADPRDSDGPRFAVHVVCEGIIGGMRHRARLSTFQGAGRMTGAPLALFAKWLASEVISSPGVHTSGRLVTDRARFDAELRVLGSGLLEDLDMEAMPGSGGQ